ncbi:glycosyltransferase family 4 protein [Candidatus Peregrinibacteria bacterium]|nr:MAG: glycosyltransferase family 4 protein [Candidatus Peregrinibacteria bacterium]
MPVSENTLRDLHKLFPFTRKKPALIASPAVPEDIHAVDTQKLDLPKKFILAVGTLLPRKNIALLFKTFELLQEKHPDLHLVVVGSKTSKSQKTFAAVQVLPPPVQTRIHFLGSVTGPQLCELYSRALVFAFPSFYEGFGIPPLEAMACGCPVIASTSSSIPEVVGDAALLASPHKPIDWAEGIEQLLDPLVASRYQKKGLLQVQKFSWSKTAQSLLQVL